MLIHHAVSSLCWCVTFRLIRAYSASSRYIYGLYFVSLFNSLSDYGVRNSKKRERSVICRAFYFVLEWHRGSTPAFHRRIPRQRSYERAERKCHPPRLTEPPISHEYSEAVLTPQALISMPYTLATVTSADPHASQSYYFLYSSGNSPEIPIDTIDDDTVLALLGFMQKNVHGTRDQPRKTIAALFYSAITRDYRYHGIIQTRSTLPLILYLQEYLHQHNS